MSLDTGFRVWQILKVGVVVAIEYIRLSIPMVNGFVEISIMWLYRIKVSITFFVFERLGSSKVLFEK